MIIVTCFGICRFILTIILCLLKVTLHGCRLLSIRVRSENGKHTPCSKQVMNYGSISVFMKSSCNCCKRLTRLKGKGDHTEYIEIIGGCRTGPLVSVCKVDFNKSYTYINGARQFKVEENL